MQNQLKLVKTLVMVLSALLVGGLGLAVYGVAQMASTKSGATTKPAHKGETPETGTVITQENHQLSAFGTVFLGQPAGSEIRATNVDDGMVAITVGGGGLADRVILVRTGTGEIQGTLRLDSAPE